MIMNEAYSIKVSIVNEMHHAQQFTFLCSHIIRFEINLILFHVWLYVMMINSQISWKSYFGIDQVNDSGIQNERWMISEK